MENMEQQLKLWRWNYGIRNSFRIAPATGITSLVVPTTLVVVGPETSHLSILDQVFNLLLKACWDMPNMAAALD